MKNNENFESINDMLSRDEMKELVGGGEGRQFWGWGYTYGYQTMSSGTGNTSATGDYGSYYVLGIRTSTGFRQNDFVPGQGDV